MSLQPMMIAPFVTGLDTDLTPWIAPPDSFQEIRNAHILHGFVEKRAGLQFFSSLAGGDRVMGIQRYINSDGSKRTLAWNTARAFRYDPATGLFDILDAAPIMSGSATDYIWAVNWQATGGLNRLYFTNGKAWNGATLDGIRFYDDTGAITTSFIPVLNTAGTKRLYGAKLLFTLRQRLLVLFTFENDGITTSTHPQRMRWCAAQNPNNWNETSAGGGGFVDAPTGEQIISARQLQDLIIVYFTNSVWTIRPVPDPALPFRWDRLNAFRACEGKMASIGYDRYVAALGVRGITASDSNQTTRIDDRITDFVVDNINVEEFGKVYCERDYQNKRWWSLFPNTESAENDSALIYDDDSKAYSIYDISLNCLGYGNASQDYGLDDFSVAKNLDYSLADMANETLQSYYYQKDQDIFLGGNITGDIFELEMEGSDNGDSIASEMITAAWNPFQKEGVECQMSYIDIYLDSHPTAIATIEFFKDSQFAPYASQQIDFLPDLGFIAIIQAISQANPASVNAAGHGLATGDTIYIYGAEGMPEINGEPYVITVVDENNFTLDGVDSTAFGVYTTNGQVVYRQFYRQRIWKRAFAGGIGNEHYIRITSEGADRPFRFHAFKPYFAPKGTRTID